MPWRVLVSGFEPVLIYPPASSMVKQQCVSGRASSPRRSKYSSGSKTSSCVCVPSCHALLKSH